MSTEILSVSTTRRSVPEINKQIRKFKIQNSSLCSQPDGAFASSSLVAGQAVRSDVPPSWCQHVPPLLHLHPHPHSPPPPLSTWHRVAHVSALRVSCIGRLWMLPRRSSPVALLRRSCRCKTGSVAPSHPYTIKAHYKAGSHHLLVSMEVR